MHTGDYHCPRVPYGINFAYKFVCNLSVSWNLCTFLNTKQIHVLGVPKVCVDANEGHSEIDSKVLLKGVKKFQSTYKDA